MKWIKTSLLTAIILCSGFTQAKTLDRIVAVVNADVVTALELNERIAMIKNQYRSNPSVLPSDTVLAKQVLDALILESLQLQMAERGNLVIPEQQVDAAINNIAQNQKLTQNQLLQAVQANGQTVEEFRDQIRRELTVSELQKQVVGRQIFVSDSEVDRFLTSQSGQSLEDTQYRLQYIRFDAAQSTEAKTLVDALNAGGQLAETAESRDLGLRALAEVPTLFRTLVPVLNLNEAVLLERDDAVHVAQLIEKTETKSINVEEFNLRHILITTDALFDRSSAQTLLADLRNRILNGESMADLANEFSQDPGTRGRGGELGWSTLDNFVPEFSQAARSATIGEITEVFESPYGFHILLVEDKRTRDVGLDVQKNRIRNQIYQQRYSESLQRWLTELRAESYVEIRP